jgi:hypothetical protein
MDLATVRTVGFFRVMLRTKTSMGKHDAFDEIDYTGQRHRFGFD